MARYRVTLTTNKPVDETFAYMADLRNFAAWDPGVLRVDQVDGDGAGPDAVFDVDVKALGGRDLTLRYETVTYDAPHEVVVEASSRLLTSRDRITVQPHNGATEVVYDAQLLLKGPLGVADIVLRPLFDRIASRAADGLRDALDAHGMHR